MIIIQLQMCELKLPCHDRHKHVTDHDVKLAIMPSSTTVHIVVFGNINHIKSGCSFTEPLSWRHIYNHVPQYPAFFLWVEHEQKF